MLISKMTNFEGMPSYFWVASSRVKEPVQDDVPYTSQALKQDLLRIRNAWEECQANRARNAIYGDPDRRFRWSRGGRLKVVWTALTGQCGYKTRIRQLAASRSPQ